MNKSIVLGGGCFWCTEAVFQRLRGVESVVSGYAGGGADDIPDYWSLHKPGNEHAEVIRVTYDPEQISLETLLEVFFNTHDPTTNQQPGTADKGEEYRSIVLYGEGEAEVAEAARTQAQEEWSDPIITELKPLDKFTPAEDEHQDFYNRNKGRNGYCSVIIDPKLKKFNERFADLLVDNPGSKGE